MLFLESGKRERRRQQQQERQQQQQFQQYHNPPSFIAATASVAEGIAATRFPQHQQPQKRRGQGQQRQSSSSKSLVAVAPRRYFAIRKCRSLQAPAIFCSWEDCSYYVDSEEDDTNEAADDDPEFQVFDVLHKAVEYIEVYIIHQEQQDSKQQYQYSNSQNNTNLMRMDTEQRHTKGAFSGLSVAASSVNRKRSAQTAFMTQNSQAATASASSPLQQGDHHNRNSNRKKLPFASKAFAGAVAAAAAVAESSDDDNDDCPPSPGMTFAESVIDNDVNSRRNINVTQKKQRRSHTPITDDDEEFDHMLQVYKDTIAAKKAIKTNPRLQAWVKRQRDEYEAFKDESPNTTMDVDRLTRLSAAGFPFQKKTTMTWDERAAEWLEYHREHGKDPTRCSVDESKDTKRALIKWMYQQRNKYERRLAGEKTNLTDEQIKKLTEWGFRWQFSKRQPPGIKLKSWEERYQQLIEYKRLNGQDATPPARLPGLGTWANAQKIEYRKFLRGEETKMTETRLAKLNACGFDFTSYHDQLEVRRAAVRKEKEMRKKLGKGNEEKKTLPSSK